MKPYLIKEKALSTYWRRLHYNNSKNASNCKNTPCKSGNARNGFSNLSTYFPLAIIMTMFLFLFNTILTACIVLISSAIIVLLFKFLRQRYRQVKPLTDAILSFIGLIIALPLLLVVGTIIKMTSPGPVFYTQERVGKNGRLFNIIKFRSMHVDAESQSGPVWAGENDTRITSFGRFLRKTHIDELPQFINVLKGDMAIIGPRPERPHFVEQFKDEIHGYTFRLTVKPGITGLAQCYHRYDETIHDVERKLRYDSLYIKKMCWMLDINIMWRTLRISCFGEKV